MNNLPLVDVLFVHWNRPHELAASVQSMRENLRYPSLRWVVADDHSTRKAFEFIKAEVQPDIIFRTRKQSGLGINTNRALQKLDSDFVFLTMDDRVLKVPIDLRPGVDVLSRFAEFGMIRYDGLQGHDVTCRLRELPAGEAAIYEGAPAKHYVWELSKEHSNFLYVYSGQPHLKHRRFHEHYGWYIEGWKLGATEEEFAHRFLDTKDGPSVMSFPGFIFNHFDHIGHSWQHTKHDRGYPGNLEP